ncbi:methyltransferase [Candidatus Woesearchaeota archaeon]|nr:methyltransferase [Candidatus Woesearchaeota archaeon]
MPNCKSVYEPREDSTMLEAWVKKYAFGKVLDMGTGSGIQAIAAAQKSNVKSVLAVDVQRGVIEYCRKNIKNKKIKFMQSDLFGRIKEKFNTIIFNPPYLPQELKLKDLTIEGGKKGYEVIEKFLNEANNFLNSDGIILMAFSSLTMKDKVDGFIKNNMLDFEELDKMHIFFEDIYFFLLTKNEFLKKLENKGISGIKYFAKGHRGLLFTGTYKKIKIVIKTKNSESTAYGRIENEAKWLKKLNRLKIGPKLLLFDNGYFIYEFIAGDFILDYLKKSDAKGIRKIIRKIFNQLFILDKLKIDKEEMHHPVKHILVRKGKPYMIDFERTHYSQKPKNVTQFCQFLMSGSVNEILRNKKNYGGKNSIIQLAKIYKNEPSNCNLNTLINSILK